MNIIDKLERKYGKYAINNLMKIIATGMAFVFVLDMFAPILLGEGESFSDFLDFSYTYIVSGQIWRIFTFIFVPDSDSWLIIIHFLILIFFSDVIEGYYGTFRLNLYIFMGCIGTIVANIIIEHLLGAPYPVINGYLYYSLMLLAATMVPDFEIYLYFLIPIKLKYWAIIGAIVLSINFVFSFKYNRILIVFSLLNFALFMLIRFFTNARSFTRRTKYQTKVNKAYKQVSKAKKPRRSSTIIEVAFHCCEVCGRTERDEPSLEFRYCSKCDGMHEYCSEHIGNHEHIHEDVLETNKDENK